MHRPIWVCKENQGEHFIRLHKLETHFRANFPRIAWWPGHKLCFRQVSKGFKSTPLVSTALTSSIMAPRIAIEDLLSSPCLSAECCTIVSSLCQKFDILSRSGISPYPLYHTSILLRYNTTTSVASTVLIHMLGDSWSIAIRQTMKHLIVLRLRSVKPLKWWSKASGSESVIEFVTPGLLRQQPRMMKLIGPRFGFKNHSKLLNRTTTQNYSPSHS